MVAAVRQIVTVGPGGRIEVQSPRLREGDRAEVIVLAPVPPASTARSQLEALKKLQESMRLSPEAADKWIDGARAERQAWGNRG